MKIYELLEAVVKPKFTAQIFFGHSFDLTNISKAPSKEAVKDAEKKAKAKFNELKAAHQDKLKFATPAEATEYMKSMELDWPLDVWRIHGNHVKTKKATANWDGWEQPAELTYDDVQLTDLGDGKVKVHVATKTGPALKLVYSLVSTAMSKKYKVYNQLGHPVKNIYTFKSNAATIVAPIDALKKWLDRSKEEHIHYDKMEVERVRIKNDPEEKKARNKLNYEIQKDRKEELYKTYGKNIVDRVKIRSMSHEGDDGYQWAMFVDGQRVMSGMTRDQAAGEQRMRWAYLLKVSKMSPEELQREADIAAGWKAYFMLQRLETQLNSYLGQVNRNAKGYVDADTKAKSAIGKASGKVDPAEEMEKLIAKLRKKVD